MVLHSGEFSSFLEGTCKITLPPDHESGQRRAVSSSKRSSLIRIVDVATATSGIVYDKSNPDAGTKISLAIPEFVRESLSLLPWQISQGLIHRPDQSFFGNITAFSSRVAPESKYPVEAPDSPKLSDGYLGRDTIDNAAARI